MRRVRKEPPRPEPRQEEFMAEPKPSLAGQRAAELVVDAGALCVRLCQEWRLPVPGHEYFRVSQLAGKMLANGGDLEEIERVLRSTLTNTHGAPPPPPIGRVAPVPLVGPRED